MLSRISPLPEQRLQPISSVCTVFQDRLRSKTLTFEFFVAGIPQPKGSTRSFYSKKQGRTFTRNAKEETTPWEATIRAGASAAGCTVLHGPVRVYAVFTMPRIKGHFRRDGTLKPGAPTDHASKPDLDKLARTLLDGLTALAFVDDSQVASLSVVKQYASEGDQPGVHAIIESIGEDHAGSTSADPTNN